MANLGKIESVAPRDVWKDEARDFTPWLASEEGLALLGEELGMELDLIAMESRVGSFKADIVARVAGEEDESIIVIENQLETTNHDHLGKIITYAAGHDAKTCVWVTPSFRDEHREAMDWLNANMPEIEFFALEIGVIKIGNSDPAPQLKLVSSPNEWTKAIKAQQSREVSETKLDQLGFWEEFKSYAAQQPEIDFPISQKARPRHWYTIAMGRTAVHMSLTVTSFNEGRVGCEVYFGDENAKTYFDKMYSDREEIEAELGYTLDWQRLEERKASRIVIYREGLFSDEAMRQELIEWLYEKATEFRKVFVKRVQKL